MHENYWFCYWKHLEEPRHQAACTGSQSLFFPSWPFLILRGFLPGLEGLSEFISYIPWFSLCKWRSYLPSPTMNSWVSTLDLQPPQLFWSFKYGNWLHTWALGPTYEFCNHSLILVSFSVLLVKLWEPQVQAPITRELLYHVTEDGNLRKPFPQLNLSSLKSLLLGVCHRNEKTNIIFSLNTAPKSLEVSQLCQMRPAYYIQRAISSDLTTFGCLKPATLPPRAEKTTNSTHTHTNLAQCGYCLYTTVWKTTCLLLAF